MSDVGQYQQPWGQPLRDPEILSHMSTLQRPNPRVVKIPNFEAASANPPDDGTPPPVYQDGSASLNDVEWRGQVWMTYCGDVSNVKLEFVKLEGNILRITEAGIDNEKKRKLLGGPAACPSENIES